MKKAIFFCVMMIVAGSMWAQEEYHIKTYGINDELKTRGTTCLAQVNGILWIGTSDGLKAFDGIHMYYYTIPDDEGLGGYFSCVTSLAASSENSLWIGSRKGIYHFDMSRERLYKFTTDDLPENPRVKQLLFDNEGHLWSIMSGKVYIIDVNAKTAECIGNGFESPSCMMMARDGTVWLGSDNGKLYRYDATNHRLREYDVKPEGTESFSQLMSITEMRNGQLALVSYNDGICLFSPKTLTSKMLMTHDDEGSPIVAHTSITPAGDQLWVGTERGIIIYRIRDGRITSIRQSRHMVNTLSDNSVHSLLLDRENGVWAGTYFGGMNRISLSPQNFSVYLPEDDDVEVVREVIGDHYGRIWAGTEDGSLYLLDKEKGVLVEANVDWCGAPLPFNAQGLVLVDDDLWVSSITNGIYVVDTKTMRLKHRYPKTNKTPQGTTIEGKSLCYQNGTLFVSSWRGVYIFDEKTEEFNLMPELNGVYAQRIYGDRHGNVWVASFNQGVWKIQQGKDGKWKGKQTAFTYKCATSILEDSRGLYWVGTDIHGLMTYDDKTGKTEQMTVSERLMHETVTNIIEDSHRRLWISTFNGLYSYNLSKKVINHVTQLNGLPSNYLNYASGYQDEHGTVYIGTYKGMISYTPASFVLSKERLKPYFLMLFVNGQHVTPNDETGILKQTLFQTKELTLTRDQNTFTIMYAVPSYRSGEIVWYRYRMNPDEPWTVTDNAQPIQLSNLSTGTYRITLQASYNPERWEGEAAVLIVKVKSPIWLSPFAFICYAAVIIGLVVLVMWLIKKNEIKKIKQESED
ncbi:MAG: hypothetical protein J5790_04625 [Bacteroidaceae bacterium]|nr:hypothetical protein [Bacteroidaceae bacterium]